MTKRQRDMKTRLVLLLARRCEQQLNGGAEKCCHTQSVLSLLVHVCGAGALYNVRLAFDLVQ